ncbi:MAG TPA: hypothetical protein VIC35_00165 [Acidimicrobiia bacterium]
MTLSISPGPVTVAAAGAPGVLSNADRDAIVGTVRTYVTDATIDPLLGKRVGNLSAVFAPAALAGTTGVNAAVLTDAGMPKASKITATAQPISITALSDPARAIGLVGAPLNLQVSARTKKGLVQVHRVGELALVREGGSWRIMGFRLAVSRAGADIGTTVPSTSASGGAR